MATLTKGRTFVSGETVTPTKLNDLVDNATIAFVTADDTDDSTLEASGGKLRVKDGGITATKLATGAALPAGAVMPFARATAPAGWLIANGDVVPNGSGTVQGVTADFSALYAAVSTSFGTAGTLPDLRGIFVRGSDSQTISGTAYSGTFAAKQQDGLRDHSHRWKYNNLNLQGGGNTIENYDAAGASSVDIGMAPGTAAGETRPANIALLYCIKH